MVESDGVLARIDNTRASMFVGGSLSSGIAPKWRWLQVLTAKIRVEHPR